MLLSDPHVMGPGLLVSEGGAWDYALAYDRKLNDYSRAIFDEAIAIALRERPDIFLISGDLTKDGEWRSHQHIVQRLYELRAAGIKPLVIPGNHDMGTDNALYFDGDDSYPADTISARQFAELYSDFGYGDAFEREPTTLTWCCEPVEGLVIIGIDTGYDGELLNGVISHATFEWVAERAKTADNAGKQVLVMMHHALFPHVLNAEKVSSTYAVKLGMPTGDGAYVYYPYNTLRNHLADAGVRVVLSGHVHALDIAKDSNKSLTRSIYEISTASCAAYPNAYRLLTLDDDYATMRVETRYITELPGVDDFAAMAEDRMTQGLENIIYGLIYNREFSSLFAELFKTHVAGNEPQNPRQQEFMAAYEAYLPQIRADMIINSYLAARNVTVDEMTAMVYGMLQDKSNYGDPERESQADDLRLTIDLREQGWTAVRTVNRAVSDDACYTLQGLRVREPSKKGVYVRNGRLFVNK